MPIKISNNSIDYSEAISAFDAILKITNLLDNNTAFSVLPGSNISKDIPETPLITNTLSIVNRKSKSFGFAFKSFIVDKDNPSHDVLALHQLDIQQNSDFKNRVVRFTEASNLTKADYAHLLMIGQLLRKATINVSTDIIKMLAKPENTISKNEVIEMIPLYKAQIVEDITPSSWHRNIVINDHGVDLYNQISIDLITKEANGKSYQETHDFQTKIKETIISIINFSAIYHYIANNVPLILDEKLWEKGFI